MTSQDGPSGLAVSAFSVLTPSIVVFLVSNPEGPDLIASFSVYGTFAAIAVDKVLPSPVEYDAAKSVCIAYMCQSVMRSTATGNPPIGQQVNRPAWAYECDTCSGDNFYARATVDSVVLTCTSCGMMTEYAALLDATGTPLIKKGA